MAFLRTLPRYCASNKLLKCWESGVRVNNGRISMVELMNNVDERGYSTREINKPVSRQIDSLDLKFDDPVASFKSKTTMELVRAYVVYQICSLDYVVENNMTVSFILFFFVQFMQPSPWPLGHSCCWICDDGCV